MKFLRRLFALVRRDRIERELNAELQFHIERETEENIRRGMNLTDARQAAQRSFGGVEQTKEECRDARQMRWLETLWQDLRYGVRVLWRNPGYTITVILTLAAGVGINTAIFSIIYGVLLRPLPYQHGSELVVVRQQAPLAGVNNLGFSVKEIEDYRAQNQTLRDVVEHHSMTFTLFGRSEPELIRTAVVSANFFDVMGVRPLMGRSFRSEDEAHGADAVLVLSHEYWQRSHHGDPHIVGKVFRMNNRPHTVIGVLPPIPQYPSDSDVYMPTSACPTRSSEQFRANRNARMMNVFGRLKPGAQVEQAQADLGMIAERIKQQYPESYPANRGHHAEVTSLHQQLTQQARPTFLILLGTAGLVLLIACANVANLALVRVMRREREMAVRTALGANRGRLIRQLLTESTLLALASGALGILFASLSMNLLVKFASRFTPRASEIKLDLTVLLFTLLISLVAGLLFGLLPALAVKVNLTSALKDGGLQSSGGVARQRLRNALVTAQVAVSFMLLIGAGLMTRSLLKLQEVNPGFDPERVLVMRVSPNWSKYTTNQQYRDFSLRLQETMKTQPGVLSAAISNNYPLSPFSIANGPFQRNFQIEGRAVNESELAPQADLRSATPDYFETLRLATVSGRVFTTADHDKAQPVAVINQSLARHRWGNENPVGRRVSLDQGTTWITIVGVIGDVRHYGLQQEPTDEIYFPIAQRGGGGFLLLRTAAEPESVIRQARNVVYTIDPETAIDQVSTLEERRSEALASPRLTATLLDLFAVLALVITVVGLTGVMALSVAQRSHELGIRLALGATQGNVMWMVLQQGLKMVLIGLAIGIVGALALTRMMTTLLFAIEPTDPLTFLAVSFVLLAVAALACFLPARRVTSIDPLLALRNE